jgi:fido (protein-threonine AMPylation protein)
MLVPTVAQEPIITTPSEKLADALNRMQAVQTDGIVRSSQLGQTYLERLTKAGFLCEIIRGWYYVANPATSPGSTAWYGHYWNFLRQYLNEKFGKEYCLLPEPSLALLTGATVVPKQIAVMRPTPGQQVLKLCLDTSLFIYQDRANFPQRTVEIDGIQVMELHEALARVPEVYFRQNPDDALLALRLLRDPTALLRHLLEGGKSVVAGRLAGAFRHIGDARIADRIVQTLKGAGYDVRETDPFDKAIVAPASTVRLLSPHVARLQAMWAAMRGDVLEIFPVAPGLPERAGPYMAAVDEKYVQDAYHSLSIEGYRVSPELIEKIKFGKWNPEGDASDRQTVDVLAARGYLEAFRLVKESVRKIIDGSRAPAVVRMEHHDWYQALFAPAVQGGLLPPAAFAGYRDAPVFIRGSRHVPLPGHAIADAMEALFDLLEQETESAVQAVLGHFAFVFIHPYPDGNGRMARFLMNALLAGGGFPWTIIHLENRARYREALEEASVNKDIRPFATIVRDEMLAGRAGVG